MINGYRIRLSDDSIHSTNTRILLYDKHCAKYYEQRGKCGRFLAFKEFIIQQEKKKRNVQLIKMKSDMDVILIWLAICWEVEKGAGMSKKFTKEGKFELRLAEYLDG